VQNPGEGYPTAAGSQHCGRIREEKEQGYQCAATKGSQQSNRCRVEPCKEAGRRSWAAKTGEKLKQRLQVLQVLQLLLLLQVLQVLQEAVESYVNTE
jgi:hypothetical protein